MAGVIRLSSQELEIAKAVGMSIIEYATEKHKLIQRRAKWREASRRYRAKKKLLKLANQILEK